MIDFLLFALIIILAIRVYKVEQEWLETKIHLRDVLIWVRDDFAKQDARISNLTLLIDSEANNVDS